MKTLVVGTGAREHAIVRGLAADPQVEAVLAAPGNPGIAQIADCRPVDANDGDAVAALAEPDDRPMLIGTTAAEFNPATDEL